MAGELTNYKVIIQIEMTDVEKLNYIDYVRRSMQSRLYDNLRQLLHNFYHDDVKVGISIVEVPNA